MGDFGGVFYRALGKEIRLFYGLGFLVDDFQSAEGIVIIVTAENLRITAVGYAADLKNKALLLRDHSNLQGYQFRIGAVSFLCGEHFTECGAQFVQTLYSLGFLSSFRYLGHDVVFTEIHLSVNLGKGEIADIFDSRDNAGFLFSFLRPLSDSVCQL